MKVLGKDGTPFDQARYEDWALRSRNSSIQFKPWKRGRKGGLRWDCPVHGVVRAGAIRKHKRECR